jgi:hypothetical protein
LTILQLIVNKPIVIEILLRGDINPSLSIL